jgi:hypothetical protein
MAMRKKLVEALKSHARGHIDKHLANIEVYLQNAAGVGEHPDIVEAIEKELDIVAQYHDQLEVIATYLDSNSLK